MNPLAHAPLSVFLRDNLPAVQLYQLLVIVTVFWCPCVSLLKDAYFYTGLFHLCVLLLLLLLNSFQALLWRNCF